MPRPDSKWPPPPDPVRSLCTIRNYGGRGTSFSWSCPHVVGSLAESLPHPPDATGTLAVPVLTTSVSRRRSQRTPEGPGTGGGVAEIALVETHRATPSVGVGSLRVRQSRPEFKQVSRPQPGVLPRVGLGCCLRTCDPSELPRLLLPRVQGTLHEVLAQIPTCPGGACPLPGGPPWPRGGQAHSSNQ